IRRKRSPQALQGTSKETAAFLVASHPREFERRILSAPCRFITNALSCASRKPFSFSYSIACRGQAIQWATMSGDTTAAVQRYLDELANLHGETPAEPIVRALLAAAVDRLHLLCRTLLFRSYPRLARPPLNLQTEEMLDAVVERLL